MKSMMLRATAAGVVSALVCGCGGPDSTQPIGSSLADTEDAGRGDVSRFPSAPISELPGTFTGEMSGTAGGLQDARMQGGGTLVITSGAGGFRVVWKINALNQGTCDFMLDAQGAVRPGQSCSYVQDNVLPVKRVITKAWVWLNFNATSLMMEISGNYPVDGPPYAIQFSGSRRM
ncbi:MAG: hypothetical protein NVSMB1_14320 [Polyangiales bacterium]